MFAQLLRVPAPVSASQLAPPPSKYGPPGSPLRSARLAAGGGLAPGLGLGGGGGGAPLGGGCAAPLLSSRYASMAAGL